MAQVQHGCLLIADIGGYTSYVTSVELEHSQDVLADLIQTMVATLCGPFTLAKLEGDAVFCYFNGDAPGEALVQVVDDTYHAFHRRLRDIKFATTCRCEACLRIPTLTLKFVVHSGEYMIHDVAGNAELVGGDVILLHRLLKNRIAEEHGLTGYAFLTDACVLAHHIDPATLDAAAHTERFDDVGDVAGAVYDLDRRRAARDAAVTIRITDADGDVMMDAVFPADRATLWEWLTFPSKKEQWSDGMTKLTQFPLPDGPGVGTVNHCMHGHDVVLEEIVDWKPLDYYTSRYNNPHMGPATWTYELRDADDGTRLRILSRLDGGAEQAAMAEQIREGLGASLQVSEGNLRAVLAAEA